MNRWIPLALLMAGCTEAIRDRVAGRNYDPIPLHKISLGNTKDEVVQALGNPSTVAGAKQFPGAAVEAWEYQRWREQLGPDYVAERVWVYFLDGKVVQWGPPAAFEVESQRIYDGRKK